MDSIDGFINSCFRRAREYGDSVEEMPQGDDFGYHAAFRGFRQLTESHKQFSLDVIDSVLAAHTPANRRVAMRSLPSKAARYKAVVEGIDTLLENVDHLLDASRGSKLGGNDQQALSFGAAPTSTQHQLVKPQLSFAVRVDNSREPFRPLIFDESGTLTRGVPGENPYRHHISTFNYPPEQLQPRDEVAFTDVDTSPFSFVESVEELAALVATLAQASEFAVDLEHHSYHSFQGFTCLMQISTRVADYVIDCLKLREHMWRLKPAFLDPRILKVFHGAHEDIKWLQKDFGIYVANMFDTGIAMQTLRMPHSLYNVVDYFCQVKLDKKYQNADWRIRPLSREMITYARLDTHYLLYSFDRLRILLLNSENHALGNLLLHVFQESRRVCLSRYEKPMLDEDRGYIDSMGPSLGGLNSAQRAIAREVFNWRDRAARDADESPPAVMHNSSILQIALRQPTVPSEMLKTVNPVTLTVRKLVNDIIEIVQKCTSEHGGAQQSRRDAAATPQEGDGGDKPGGSARKRFMPQTGMLPSVELDGIPMLSVAEPACSCVADAAATAWISSLAVVAAETAGAITTLPSPQLSMPRQRLVTVPVVEATFHEKPATPDHQHSLKQEQPSDEEQATTGSLQATAAAEPAFKHVMSLAEEYGVGRQTRRKAGNDVGAKRKRN